MYEVGQVWKNKKTSPTESFLIFSINENRVTGKIVDDKNNYQIVDWDINSLKKNYPYNSSEISEQVLLIDEPVIGNVIVEAEQPKKGRSKKN